MGRWGATALAAVALVSSACGADSRAITTTTSAGSFPRGEIGAIVALGESGAGQPDGEAGHHHGQVMPTTPLVAEQASIFDAQLAVARASVESRDTLEEAEALGYVLASAPIGGIGAHFVHWSQIAHPFDLASPSMLLFDVRQSPPRLVGYSYAVQSVSEPEGYVGTNDHWHRHRGLCVDQSTGWVIREGMASAEGCDGTYLAGGDLWMLHAWIVPGFENSDGLFEVFNPRLCPPVAGTPDIIRCPES